MIKHKPLPKECDIRDLIRNKHYEPLIQFVFPIIEKIAQKFAAVRTPTCILEKDDYIQSACESVIECVNVFDLNKTKDAESCKAKFLYLCHLKITSRCIEMQKALYLPVCPSRCASSIHHKVNQMEQNDMTVESVSAKFNTSHKFAEEAIGLVLSKFQTISADNGNFDIPISNKTADRIYAQEILSYLTDEEREILYSVFLDKIYRKTLAAKYNMPASKFFHYFNEIVDKVKTIVHKESISRGK